jgi:hypothetical protein
MQLLDERSARRLFRKEKAKARRKGRLTLMTRKERDDMDLSIQPTRQGGKRYRKPRPMPLAELPAYLHDSRRAYVAAMRGEGLFRLNVESRRIAQEEADDSD